MPHFRFAFLALCVWSMLAAPALVLAATPEEEKEKAWASLSETACGNAEKSQKTIDILQENIEGMEKFQQDLPDHKLFKPLQRDMESILKKMQSIRGGMKRYKASMHPFCRLKRPAGLEHEEEVARFNTQKAAFDKELLNYEAYSKQYESAFARYVQAVREYQRLISEPIPIQ